MSARDSLIASARDFVWMLKDGPKEGNLAPALAYIQKLADHAERCEKLLHEVKDGKHSVPGTLVQIKRLLGE